MANIYSGRKLTNPDFKIIDVPFKNGKVHVIDESHLFGGTKQRLLGELVANLPHTTMVYAGISIGYGALAMGYCCRLYGKAAVWFTDSANLATQAAQKLGVSVIFKDGSLSQLIEAARKYTSANVTRYLVPFGIVSNPTDKKVFEFCLRPITDKVQPARIWVASSSGCLSSMLRNLFPAAHLCIVRVGMRTTDVVSNSTVYNVGKSFQTSANILPPYDSPAHYDAKIWEAMQKHGISGDYVWNAAGVVTMEKTQAAINEIDAQISWFKDHKPVVPTTWPRLSDEMPATCIMFENLKVAALKLEPTKHVKSCFTHDYNNCTGISNHYTELARIKCIASKTGVSPLGFWNANTQAIHNAACMFGVIDQGKIKPDYVHGMVHVGKMRQLITTRPFAECQTFNPLVMTNVIRLYFDHPRIDVLDPSMGWGDRAFAAFALGVKSYTGYDPNPDLVAPLKSLAADFSGLTETTMVFSKFTQPQNPDGSAKKFDLVMTSPPFHDMEIYTGTVQDAKLPFTTWVKTIYTPYLVAAATAVKQGGYLAIYITDCRSSKPLATLARKIVDPHLLFVEDLEYTGSYINPAGVEMTSYQKKCVVWTTYDAPPGF